MASDIYYERGLYWGHPDSWYMESLYTVCPTPLCRKYHISSDIDSAQPIAEIVLPYLKAKGIHHKVVRNKTLLIQQSTGDQAGKFITLYLEPNVDQRNDVIKELSARLFALQQEKSIKPCPTIPRSRRSGHVFIEQPLCMHQGCFIYGGFQCDPRA